VRVTVEESQGLLISCDSKTLLAYAHVLAFDLCGVADIHAVQQFLHMEFDDIAPDTSGSRLFPSAPSQATFIEKNSYNPRWPGTGTILVRCSCEYHEDAFEVDLMTANNRRRLASGPETETNTLSSCTSAFNQRPTASNRMIPLNANAAGLRLVLSAAR